MKYLIFISIVFSVLTTAHAQEDRIEYNYNGYNVLAVYDTVNYCSSLAISKGGKNILFDSCAGGRVESINSYDLEGKGEKILVVEYFTGGAHCCDFITAAVIKNDKYIVKDTIWWGDSGFEIKDIDGDGSMELTGYDVRFAYAFTSFAGSQFPVLIYGYRNGKFTDITKKFPKLVEKDMADFKKSLNDDYLKPGFKCPQPGEDMYSTESGPVQALLAAIAEDYYNLDRIDEAYEYINKVYKCDNKKEFIQKLKKDYKLK